MLHLKYDISVDDMFHQLTWHFCRWYFSSANSIFCRWHFPLANISLIFFVSVILMKMTCYIIWYLTKSGYLLFLSNSFTLAVVNVYSLRTELLGFTLTVIRETNDTKCVFVSLENSMQINKAKHKIIATN